MRQLFCWKRRGFFIHNEEKQQLFAHLPPEQERIATEDSQRLLHCYHLQGLYAQSSRDNYRENLFYLEMLERVFKTAALDLPSTALYTADIGVSHWFYVQALYAFLKWYGHPPPEGRLVTLLGYESDPYRVYTDLYSRLDHALAHIRGQMGVTYLPRKFTPQPNAFNIITMFFPFIFLSDHLAWGLPRTHFNPPALLGDAWNSLKPEGILVIVNQGEREVATQLRLLEELGCPILASFRHESLFYQYDQPRFITLTQHQP